MASYATWDTTHGRTAVGQPHLHTIATVSSRSAYVEASTRPGPVAMRLSAHSHLEAKASFTGERSLPVLAAELHPPGALLDLPQGSLSAIHPAHLSGGRPSIAHQPARYWGVLRVDSLRHCSHGDETPASLVHLALWPQWPRPVAPSERSVYAPRRFQSRSAARSRDGLTAGRPGRGRAPQ